MTIYHYGTLTTLVEYRGHTPGRWSLAASTRYYYRILAQNSTSVYYMPPGCCACLVAGAIFDTDSTNKQAAITWDAVAGATGYVVILSTEAGIIPVKRPESNPDHHHQQLYGHRRLTGTNILG
jgi:hypothetical protein